MGNFYSSRAVNGSVGGLFDTRGILHLVVNSPIFMWFRGRVKQENLEVEELQGEDFKLGSF